MGTPSLRRLVDALRRLRNADPASGLDTSVDAQRYAAAITGRDEVPLVDGPLATPRPRGAFLAAATLVVGVSAGAIVLAQHSADTSTTAHSGAHVPAHSLPPRSLLVRPGPSGVPVGRAADPHRAQAQALVATLLAEAPVPPGAAPLPGTGPGILRSGSFGSPNFLDRHGLWQSAGTMSSALAYVRAHLPTGWVENGSGESTDHGRITSLSLTLAPSGSFEPYATQVDVQIGVAPYQDGVAIRVDAQAIWLPTKPAAALIVDPSSVAVSVERPQHHTVHRTLGAAAARRLAARINRLDPDVFGVRSCPMDWGGTDVLRFATRSGTVVARQGVSGCADVHVIRDGRTLLTLNGTVDPTLMHLLGLPANYGFPH